MNIIFAGTPEFAIPALKAILNSEHKVISIYTQPDRPSGRGQKLTPSPVKVFAIENQLLLHQPASLKNSEVQKELQNLHADILVNVAYGALLPKEVLKTPKYGCINIHPSLLPRWRGAAPIQRAIFAGDKVTGVSIMQMDEGLDTGGIYKQKKIAIANTDTSATMFAKTSALGAELLLEVLQEIANGTAVITEQSDAGITYAKKITKEEGKIDWQKSAIEIERMVRAFNPWPVVYTELCGKTIRIWEAIVISEEQDTNEAGTVIAATKEGIDFATGKGILRLTKIQLPGGKPLGPKEILNSRLICLN